MQLKTLLINKHHALKVSNKQRKGYFVHHSGKMGETLELVQELSDWLNQ